MLMGGPPRSRSRPYSIGEKPGLRRCLPREDRRRRLESPDSRVDAEPQLPDELGNGGEALKRANDAGRDEARRRFSLHWWRAFKRERIGGLAGSMQVRSRTTLSREPP